MSDFPVFIRPDWHDKASCRGTDPDLFFPEQVEGGGTATARRAKMACAPCPVRAECLEAGLWERHGIWGGMTYKERRAERARRGLPARQVDVDREDAA